MARKKKSQKYDYFLTYLDEATTARLPLRDIINRAVKAYKQRPCHNTYKENAESFCQNIANSNPELASRVRDLCNSIPDSTNDTVHNAVETFVSMTMGGASQFEYVPADEYEEKDSQLIDRLSELAKFFHDDNKIDSIAPEMTRQMELQGQSNLYIKPIEGGRFSVSLIDAWKMLRDPRQSRTNRMRYTGYTEVRSWAAIKDEISKNKLGYQVSVVNDVDQYLDELRNWTPSTKGGLWSNELRRDLDTFCAIYRSNVTGPSKSTDDKGKDADPSKEPGYKGDDVEIAYMWDTIANVHAVTVNRRFIVHIKENPFKKNVPVKYLDNEGIEKTRQVSVEIDSPIVTIPYLNLPWETYPVSPLFYCLDDFDAICSMESVMNHNFSIMAPITFSATSYDAEQIAQIGQVAGQIVEGTMNTLGVMNKSHDMSPILAAIERREQRIKKMLGAFDAYEQQALINNRATATEASSMVAAVSQRMNAPLANIETGMSELVQKMFAMAIVFSDKDDFVFPSNGGVASVNKRDLLGRSLVRAKLKSRIRVEEAEQGRNALMVLQTLAGIPGTDVKRLASLTAPIITRGVLTRRQVESVFPEDVVIATPVPTDTTVTVDPALAQGLTPGDMEEIIGMAQMGQGQAIMDTGADNFAAGIVANDPALQGVI